MKTSIYRMEVEQKSTYETWNKEKISHLNLWIRQSLQTSESHNISNSNKLQIWTLSIPAMFIARVPSKNSCPVVAFNKVQTKAKMKILFTKFMKFLSEITQWHA